MHILFLTDNFPPEVNAPASRTYEHCREWVEAGESVTVVTCAPNFPHGRVYPGYNNKPFQVEMVDGIRVARLWTYITANEGFFKRTADYFSFAVTGFLGSFLERADVVLSTSPQFFTNFPARGFSLLKQKPWIFELRDLWPDSIRAVGAMDDGRVLRFLEKIELYFYRCATRIVALTPAFKQNLVKRGISSDKIDVIPNGVYPEIFHPREKDPELVRELRLDGKFVVGYIGTHGMAHSLDFIVSSLSYLEDPDVHFLFIGDGAEKKTIVSLAERAGINNVTFLDPVPKVEVPKYMSVCDASLVPLKRSETFKTVIPSKIFEASAMQKPILLGVEGQAKELVEEYGAGLCFEPENRDDFLSCVKRLKQDPILYEDLQFGCARLAQDYDRKHLALRMLETIRQTVYAKRNAAKVFGSQPKPTGSLERKIGIRSGSG